jgi:cell division protein FtsB
VDEYKTYRTGAWWLEQGWYTVEQLQKIIDAHNRIIEQLRKSMQPIEEKKDES